MGEIRNFTDWFFGLPTEGIRQSNMYGKLHRAHPTVASFALTPIAFIDGLIKPLIFPFVALVGSVALPVIAVGELIGSRVTKDEDKKEVWEHRAIVHLKGALVCILTTAAIGCLGIMTVYYFPLSVPLTIIIAGVGASIAIHIYRIWQPPRSDDSSKEIMVYREPESIAEGEEDER